jgi:gas vesicle protein
VHLDRIPDLVTDQVDRVRDRTAEVVGADGGSVLRELNKLGRKLDGTEKHLTKRLDEIAEMTSNSEEQLGGLEATFSKGTTWPRRLFWMLIGLGAGAAAAYLADPDRGEQRRQEIVGQAQQKVQTATEDVTNRVSSVKDQAVDRAQDVKDQAVASARSVADEAQHAAQDVADEAQHAVVDVRDEVDHAVDDVKQEASSAKGGTGAPTNAPTPLTPPPSPRT